MGASFRLTGPIYVLQASLSFTETDNRLIRSVSAQPLALAVLRPELHSRAGPTPKRTYELCWLQVTCQKCDLLEVRTQQGLEALPAAVPSKPD
jgi:hypothetical protein